MSDEFDELVVTAVESQEQAAEVVEKLFAVAQPGAVFGEPVTSGEYTVITASEVRVAMGFGYGSGGGTGTPVPEGEATDEGEAQGEAPGAGYGSGGGGGGVSGGRPVAVISIGPTGVRVEPVVDVTKLGLAFLTALGSMLILRSRMGRLARG